MVNHLFIAEKPSLAKDIAEARAEELGVRLQKSDGCWRVGDDAVTWLFGHMYESAPPEHYSQQYKQWNIDTLPIIPEEWKLLPSKDKKQHISTISTLLKDSNTVVNAGDAGREGQLLVDELLIENGWDPFSDKTMRIWIRSITRKDLLEALKAMFPNADKKSLYESAVSRQRADWALGMNTTRLFTVLARQSGNNQLVSVGRVQTPTLKLVVDRDLEIKNFKPVDHYLPQILFSHDNGEFWASWVIPNEYDGLDSEGRLIDKAVAERISQKVDGKNGKVESFSAQKKSKSPPLPYSLSTLQTECSSKFGFSAQQTLELAQSLYDEYKVTTYPRSDSQYLPVSILSDEAPKIVENLSQGGDLGDIANGADLSIKSAAWNDAKITDHHGIIPTTDATQSKIEALPSQQKKVFMIIAKTFLCQFYPDMKYLAVSATLSCEDETFKASGRRVLDYGWQKVYGKDDDEENESDDEQAVPDMEKGDSALAKSSKVKSKRTTPPPKFTDGTLVQAMSNIHRFVTNTEIKKRLKENDGIGTVATRASILETLIRRKYLQRRGKHLVSTEMGQSIIGILPDDVTDFGLTAIWEGYLEKVNRGELSMERFMEGQIEALKKRISQHKNRSINIKGAAKITPLEGHGETCDTCGKGTMVTVEIKKGDHKGKKFLACNAWNRDDPNSCKNVKWPKVKIDPISGHGESCPKCNKGTMTTRLISKGEHKGKKFLACDNWKKDDPNSCSHAVFPDTKKKVDPISGHGDACPKCGKGVMTTRLISKGDNKGKKFLSCNNWKKDDPSSCSYAVFPEDKVDKLPGDGDSCPKCGKGNKTTKAIRKGDRKGERFLSCSTYPECNFTENPGAKSPGGGKDSSKSRSGAFSKFKKTAE